MKANLNVLKEAIETLVKESPSLLKAGLSETTSTLKGLEQQCQTAQMLGYEVGPIYLSNFSSDGHEIEFKSYPVNWRYALNLIKTMKKKNEQ